MCQWITGSKDCLRQKCRYSLCLVFRDSLDLSSRELTHTRGLAQTFVAVMNLNLSKNSISSIGVLPIGLRVLDISCNILLDLQGCSALKRLEKIDVSHNRIQSFAGIEGCASLKLLYAQSNPLQIVTHIDLCPHIQLIDLSDCSITSWDGVRVLSLCKSLRQLAMKGCPVSSRPASRARIVHLVPHLTTLDGVPMPNSASNPRPPLLVLRRLVVLLHPQSNLAEAENPMP